jgi:hypothetical protein
MKIRIEAGALTDIVMENVVSVFIRQKTADGETQIIEHSDRMLLQQEFDQARYAFSNHAKKCQTCVKASYCEDGLLLKNKSAQAFNDLNRNHGGTLGPYCPPILPDRQFG